MTSVLIASDEEDGAFWDTARRVLCENYSTLLARGRCFQAPAAPARLALCDANTFETILCENTVILFRNRTQALPRQLCSGKNCVAVVDSFDEEVMRFVSETRLPAITCGLSPRDTITLSSIDVDSAVINLQRMLTCFDGTAVEPQEFPVRLGASIDNFSLMALGCVFILNGDGARLSRIYL